MTAGSVGNVGNAEEVSVDRLRAALGVRLAPDAARWLDTGLSQVTADPETALCRRFAEAGRQCGRTLLAAAPEAHPADGLPAAAPAEALAWTVDDAVRALLLAAVPVRAADAARWATAVYQGGDATERRGVLRALSLLDVGDHAVPLVTDALRTNDLRLVAAALGPYAARHLEAHAWRQAVLKCLHCSIPLRAVAGLSRRADAELARMARSYGRELTSAGRPVFADVRSLAGPPPPRTVRRPSPHSSEA
ncbi:EboA domain-containing protein [Streptomyces sp. NPDC052236]|uniref:EboA domain-containing protein n=1 Tax=Streptomyces sp. NPDC052236 TaxID=3365686 RepID=UPI0037D726B6